MARRSKKSKGVSVDFEGVEGRIVADEGTHRLRVKEVTQEKGDKADYFAWIFEVVGSGKKDKSAGASIYYNTSLSKQSLWNLRGLLEALGVEVPDSEMEIELDDFVDLEMMGEIEHETYNKKKQARLIDFWAVDEEEKGGKGKDKDDKKGGKSKKAQLPDADDVDDMDEDDIKELIEEHDLDVDPDDFPKLSKLKAAVKKAIEEADEAGDEDEDDKKGKKDKDKKGGKKKEPEKVSKDAIDDMSQEELEDVIKEHDLDVDLDEFKTLRKMRGAVADALEKEDMLDDE